MAAVVFSKVCVGTGLPKVISKYCFHTPGFGGIANTDFEEVPAHLFKEALRVFVTRQAAHLHEELIRGETRLWLAFFNRQLPESQATKMGMERFGDADHSFEAEIFGNLGSVEEALGTYKQGPDVLTSHFENEVKRLRERGLSVKPKVAISIESKLALPIQFECDTGLRYAHYLENNKPSFNLWSIDPLLPILISLAPIVKKVQQVVRFGEVSSVHTFSAVNNPVSQQLVSKPKAEATA